MARWSWKASVKKSATTWSWAVSSLSVWLCCRPAGSFQNTQIYSASSSEFLSCRMNCAGKQNHVSLCKRAAVAKIGSFLFSGNFSSFPPWKVYFWESGNLLVLWEMPESRDGVRGQSWNHTPCMREGGVRVRSPVCGYLLCPSQNKIYKVSKTITLSLEQSQVENGEGKKEMQEDENIHIFWVKWHWDRAVYFWDAISRHAPAAAFCLFLERKTGGERELTPEMTTPSQLGAGRRGCHRGLPLFVSMGEFPKRIGCVLHRILFWKPLLWWRSW